MRLPLTLLAAVLVLAAAVLLMVGAAAFASAPRPTLGDVAAPRRAVPTVACETPRLLRLDRFEDGSAKLMCGGRLLARVSVPW